MERSRREMYTVNERLHRQINPDRRLVAVKEEEGGGGGVGGQLSNTKTLFNFRPGRRGRGLVSGFTLIKRNN